MNTSVQVFGFNNHNVRTVVLDGEPWFVAPDVTRILGIANTSDALSRLDRDGIGSTDTVDARGRRQNVSTVNEPGLYELVFQSRKPEAKAFMRWVTKEVLPAIRKTGSYSLAPVAVALTPRELAQMVIAEADRADMAEQQLAIAAPKIEAFDTFMEDGDTMDVRDAAQLLCNKHGIKIGQNRLFDWLYDNGWIDRNDRAIQSKMDQKLLTMKHRDFTIKHKDGSKSKAKPQVRITPKGLAKILKIMTEPEAPRRKLRSLNP